MATTPIEGWPLPDLGTAPPDGPDAFSDLALAMEATFNSAAQVSYTPTWGSILTPGTANPVTLAGKYRKKNGWIGINIWLVMNSGTAGGVGALRFSLPFAAATNAPEQEFDGKLYLATSAVSFPVFGHVGAGDIWLYPFVPKAINSQLYENWQSADASNAAGTGRPQLPPNYSVQPGSMTISGRYRHA